MKKTVLLFTLLVSFTFAKAQLLDEIDVKVAQYPNTFTEAEELAQLINNDFETEKDKARAIYSWICMNVQFDVKTYFAKKKKRKRIKYKNAIDRAQKLRKAEIRIENKALQEHIAVAEGYTTLFKRLCDLTGVYGYVLKGTGKVKPFDIGRDPKMLNHSWNVIQIDKKWFLVDAMLGAGTVDYMEKTYQHTFNDKFFLTPPEDFFLNHFPKDEGWSFVEKTAEDFANLPLFYGEYLKADFELIEPIDGVLDLKGMDSVSFRIKSPLPMEKLIYHYSYEEEPVEINIKRKGNEYTFDIPFTLKRRGFLNLIYNKKPIITYKIGNY